MAQYISNIESEWCLRCSAPPRCRVIARWYQFTPSLYAANELLGNFWNAPSRDDRGGNELGKQKSYEDGHWNLPKSAIIKQLLFAQENIKFTRYLIELCRDIKTRMLHNILSDLQIMHKQVFLWLLLHCWSNKFSLGDNCVLFQNCTTRKWFTDYYMFNIKINIVFCRKLTLVKEKLVRGKVIQ